MKLRHSTTYSHTASAANSHTIRFISSLFPYKIHRPVTYLKMIEAILPCFRFLPTEEQLSAILIAFLVCRAQGMRFASAPVAEKVLYGDDATPWKIFGHDDAWESIESTDCGGKKGAKQVLFVLTQLTSMSTRKKARSAGCGTWHGQTGITEIMNWKGEIIGVRKMLSYRVNEDSESQPDKAQWRLHEYALAGVSLEEMKLKNINIDNYVICKVTRDCTKCETPTNDQILSKRKSEVAAETSAHHNKKFRTLKELVKSEDQEPVYNTNPAAAAEDDMEWFSSVVNLDLDIDNYEQEEPLAAAIDDSDPPLAAEAAVNDSYTPILPSNAEDDMGLLKSMVDSDVETIGFPNAMKSIENELFLADSSLAAEAEAASNAEDDMEWVKSMVDSDVETVGFTNAMKSIENEFFLVDSSSAAEATVPPLAAQAASASNADDNMQWPNSLLDLEFDTVGFTNAMKSIDNEFFLADIPLAAEATVPPLAAEADADDNMQWPNSLLNLDFDTVGYTNALKSIANESLLADSSLAAEATAPPLAAEAASNADDNIECVNSVLNI